MSEDRTQGCVQSAAGPISPAVTEQNTGNGQAGRKETKMQATVGKEAPDFEATSYHQGKFSNLRLSSFRGKWVFLCFYPGDFTFV
jgi:AhpC/TSA family